MFKKIFFLLWTASNLYAQSDNDSIAINPKYLEDQIYFGLTYNIFSNTPTDFFEDGFAYGVALGFIKDIPMNKQRNIGLGIGFGYSFNTYIQNLIVTEDVLINSYDVVINPDTYTIKTNSLEVPIEFRWRTSTLEKYKFWRIYTGVNISYVLNSKTNGIALVEVGDSVQSLALERWQYAYTLSAGYGTWNFYMNYSLVPFFNKNSRLQGKNLEMNTFRLGLIFYFL